MLSVSSSGWLQKVQIMWLKNGAIIVLGCLIYFSDGLKLPRHSVGDVRHRRQIGDGRCTLPPFPENGQWKLLQGEGKPGEKVSLSSVIIFECRSGYRVSTESPLSVCIGQWSTPKFPECEKLCPPIFPSDSYELKCINKYGREVQCTEATDGTSLEYTCTRFYETPFGFKKTLFCENDKWKNGKPVCQPICGKKIDDDKKPLIYGSKPEEKIKYPWVTAIFSKKEDSYENVCGGSILSQTIVLTAAHCVTNQFGDVLPVENYLVGAGKLYNKYKAPEDEYAQYLELWKIIVPEEYKANIRSFSADIAVLVLKEEFNLTEVVQPVCFTNVKNIHLHAGHKGEVAGWGLAEGNKPSEVLRALTIPYKYETLCADELPPDFADKYNLKDKICAGFVNQSTSVCSGDSGSGLTFKYREDNRYYIHGLVSLAPKQDFYCDIQQNALYTKVAAYYDFVESFLTKYAPKAKDCILPAHPANGKWTVDKPGRKPGDAVPSSTILTLQCNEGFRQSTLKTEIECGSAYKMPTCEELCPKLHFPKDTYYYCTDRNGQNIECSDAIDGSNMWYFCPDRYRVPGGSSNNRTCTKGSWGSPQPQCLRPNKRCGKKLDNVFNGTARIGSENPWNVGIYKPSNDTEKAFSYSCSGTIVAERVIMTSADCVTDETGIVLTKEDVSIVAGKHYRNYTDSRDLHAQYLKPSYILINPVIIEEGRNVPDMAFLITERAFDLNNFVYPVCFAHYEDVNWQVGSKGEVNRWKLNDDEVETLEVTQLLEHECDKYSISNYILLLGKICGKFEHNSTCLYPSDSGRGLVAKNPGDGKYYLFGVVSLSSDADCGAAWYIEINQYYNRISCISNVFETF